MLQMIFSPPGCGKTTTVYSMIAERREQGLTGMILMVPEQISFETERSMLHLLTASGKECVDVLSFSRLADKFFAAVGGRNKRRIDEPGKRALMQHTLKGMKGAIELYARQVSSPAFCDELIGLNAQMKRFDVTAQALIQAADGQSGVLSKKLREISLIMAEYERRLEGEYYDPLDDLTKMAIMLGEHDYFAGKTVFFDSFNGFTAQQLTVIERIIASAENVVISLCLDKNMPAADSVYSGMLLTAEKLRSLARRHGVKIASDIVLQGKDRYQNGDLRRLSREMFAPDSVACDGEGGSEYIHITKCASIYEECDHVAQTVRRLVREQGLRYREIAVIARDTEKYSGIIERAFERCAVPCFIDAKKDASDSAFVRFIVNAMRAAADFSAEGILSMLKTGISFAKEEDVLLLDNYIHVWEPHGEELLYDLCGSMSGAVGKLTDSDKAALDRINRLRAQIMPPLVRLRDAVKKGGVKNISAALFRFIQQMKAGENLNRFCAELENAGMHTEADVQRRAYDLVISLFDQLVMALEEFEIGFSDYREIFLSAVRAADIGKLPQGLDEVAVGSAERMRPRSPRVTFIIGANEGEFPSVFSGGGLFTDSELLQLKADGLELPCYDEQRATEEKFLAFAAACSPSEQLFVSCCDFDSSGAKTPSVIVKELVKLFGEGIVESGGALPESESAALARYAMDKDEDSADTAALAEYFRRTGNADFQRIESLSLPLDTALRPETAKQLFGSELHLTASRIDNFYRCAFGYFCRYGLKIRPVKQAKADSILRGTVVHYVLCRFVDQFTPQQYFALSPAAADRLIADTVYEALGDFMDIKRGDSMLMYRIRSLQGVMKGLLDTVFEELMQTDYECSRVELSFGSRDEDDYREMELELKGGGKICISGQIDRVDSLNVDGEQYVRIIDYKTGGKTFKLADVLYGQNLQMLIYLSAYRRAKKAADGADITPAGILYMPVAEPKPNSDSREIPSDEQIAALRRKAMKMNGFLLSDERSLAAMEPKMNGELVGITRKDGVICAGSVYTLEQYETLTKYVDELVVKMGEILQSGAIAVNPKDGGVPACKYCDYADVCRVTGGGEKIGSVSDADAFAAMENALRGESTNG